MIVCLCAGVPERTILAAVERGACRVEDLAEYEGVETCRALGDNGSRHLLEEILRSEEDHVNWLEAQFAQIQQMGDAHYLAQQVKKADS